MVMYDVLWYLQSMTEPVIGMVKPWYGPLSIFTNKIEIAIGHPL